MSGARVAAARVLLTAPHASTLVKLCGMHRPEDVAAANAAGPDLVGFVVDFPRSHRSVPVAVLPALTAGVDPAIARVGVFVDISVITVAPIALAVARRAKLSVAGILLQCSLKIVQHFQELRHDLLIGVGIEVCFFLFGSFFIILEFCQESQVSGIVRLRLLFGFSFWFFSLSSLILFCFSLCILFGCGLFVLLFFFLQRLVFCGRLFLHIVFYLNPLCFFRHPFRLLL